MGNEFSMIILQDQVRRIVEVLFYFSYSDQIIVLTTLMSCITTLTFRCSLLLSKEVEVSHPEIDCASQT